MQRTHGHGGVRPSEVVTFVSLLGNCSRMQREGRGGRHVYKYMSVIHDKLINRCYIHEDGSAWRTLVRLGSCKINDNMAFGGICT